MTTKVRNAKPGPNPFCCNGDYLCPDCQALLEAQKYNTDPFIHPGVILPLGLNTLGNPFDNEEDEQPLAPFPRVTGDQPGADSGHSMIDAMTQDDYRATNYERLSVNEDDDDFDDDDDDFDDDDDEDEISMNFDDEPLLPPSHNPSLNTSPREEYERVRKENARRLSRRTEWPMDDILAEDVRKSEEARLRIAAQLGRNPYPDNTLNQDCEDCPDDDDDEPLPLPTLYGEAR